jgi:Holliday junction resolvase
LVTRERSVERVLVAAVTAAGGIAYKFASPSRRGVPDRLIVLPGGRVMFIEVKAPGGRLSKLQEVEIARLRKLGASVRVIWSLEAIAGVLA